MRKLIVHIGQPKTGTSSLQLAFTASRDRLIAEGVLYPRALMNNQHVGIIPHLTALDVVPAHMSQILNGDHAAIVASAEESWQMILDDITAHDPHTIILSSESFYDVAAAGHAATLIRHFRQLADHITVVAYLRAPADLYLSLRQQDLKFFGINDPPAPNQRYRQAISGFLDTADVTLHVQPFSRARFIGNDIVSDFATRFLPQGPAQLLQQAASQTNISISAEAMAVFDDIHLGHAPDGHDVIAQLTPRITDLIVRRDNKLAGKTRPKYKPGIAAVVHQTSQDLEWLADTFGITFPQPEPAADADQIAPADLRHTRDLVDLDEARYKALWRLVAEAKKTLKFRDDWPRLARAAKAFRNNPLAKLRHKITNHLKKGGKD